MQTADDLDESSYEDRDKEEESEAENDYESSISIESGNSSSTRSMQSATRVYDVAAQLARNEAMEQEECRRVLPFLFMDGRPETLSDCDTGIKMWCDPNSVRPVTPRVYKARDRPLLAQQIIQIKALPRAA